jgi:tetratricopeptide (TPR) repeat protein
MATQTRGRVLRWQATIILTLFFTAVAGAAAIGWWYARESPAHQGPLVVVAIEGWTLPAAAPQAPLEPAGPSDTERISETPALDALAADAVVFERAYTHSPLTLPAVASMMTGRLPFEHGVRDDAGYDLEAEERTLAELLRNRGFRTGAAVASPLLRREGGVTQGFAEFVESAALDLPDGLVSAGSRSPFRSAGSPDALEAALETRAAESSAAAIAAAEEWAQAQEGQRYFLFLQIEADRAEDAVSRLTTLLRTRGLYEDATVIVLGTRGVDALSSFDERSLRVPLLVKQPKEEGAGRRIAVPVQHIDLLPTMLDLVRAPIPGGLRGRSLQPLLRGREGRIVPQPVYSESVASFLRFGGHPLFALTVGDATYLRGVTEEIVRIDSAEGSDPIGSGGTSVEPSALEVVPATGPEPLAPLRATLDRLLAGHVIAPPTPPPAAMRERLALAAGYLPTLTVVPGVTDVRAADSAAQLSFAIAHQRAASLVGQRRVTQAIRALQRIAREQPTLATVHYQIGVLSASVGLFQEAIAALEAAAALRPDAPEIPAALAAALLESGRAHDAQASADLAVSLAHTLTPRARSEAHQLAARVALARGDTGLALEHADAAQAADPAVPMRPLIEAAVLIGEDRFDEAVTLLQHAAATLRQHETALEGVHAQLGQALAQLNRREEAEAAYLEELKDYPGGFAAYAGLARLYRGWKTDDDLDALVARMIAASPDPGRYAAVAGLLGQIGLPSRAEAIRSEARSRFRGDSSPALLARDTRR